MVRYFPLVDNQDPSQYKQGDLLVPFVFAFSYWIMFGLGQEQSTSRLLEGTS